MDTFISTDFKKQYIPNRTTFYRFIRRYGRILTQHEIVTDNHVKSILTIAYDDIYQIVLIDGDEIGLYDLTRMIEFTNNKKRD